MSPEDDWKRRLSSRRGPQYMNADGSLSSDKPNYLRPLPPAPPPAQKAGIQLSEEAARKIAEAIKIFLREPPRRKGR